jgi:hypothetical protein
MGETPATRLSVCGRRFRWHARILYPTRGSAIGKTYSDTYLLPTYTLSGK